MFKAIGMFIVGLGATIVAGILFGCIRLIADLTYYALAYLLLQ